MRITNQIRRNQMLVDLERLQTDLYKAQTVLSSGREVERSSDDPIRAQRAMVLRSSLAQRGQYLENLRTGMSRLSFAESILMSIDDLLAEARADAIKVSNDPSIPAEKEAVAQSINGLLEELLSNANSRQDGAYLFGGFNTQEPPYVAIRDEETGDITQIVGNSTHMGGKIMITAADDLSVQINMNGNEMFQTGLPGDEGDMFQALIDMRDALRIENNEEAIALLENSIGLIDNSLSKIHTGMTDLGGRYNRLLSIEQSHLDMEIREEEDLGEAEDGELAEWITRFQLQTVALQQAMAVGTQVLNSSIINFMR
ncbi:MAG TPA: flagellar hook-associated protein 3 [Bacteroidetes bacterium]|nr:flagellar hook-associated protein 3 [bacterium BMS3Bbin04]HDO64482.1 flagellar hook-associated protein 3 [Bacteroidota bacterium]HEX03607.1 flagellar hook-associated protein 3 [Bacteroidota bacterium]